MLPTNIVGNPELWSLPDIQRRAWPIAKTALDGRRSAELAKYWNLVAHDRTSDQLEDIIVAAHAGAVETLFVDPAVRRFGRFFPETSTVHLDEFSSDAAEDLINLAVVLVLKSSGWVEVVESGQVPGGGAAAAIMRYRFAPATGGSQLATKVEPTRRER